MLAAMTEQTESRKQRAARRAGEFPPAPEPLPRARAGQPHPPGHHRRRGRGPRRRDRRTTRSPRRSRWPPRSAWTGWSRSASTSPPPGGAPTSPTGTRAVLATVALHPNEAPRLADLDEALREIEALAARDRVRGDRRDRAGLLPYRRRGAGRAGGELPRAHRHRQAVRQGAGHPRPRRARRRAAGPRRRGRPGHGGAALLLRRRRVRRRVRPPGLPAQLRRHGHLRQRRRAARGRRGSPRSTRSWWRPTRRT